MSEPPLKAGFFQLVKTENFSFVDALHLLNIYILKSPFFQTNFEKNLQLRVTQIEYTDSYNTDCKNICFSLVKRCIYNFPQTLKPFDCKCIESTDIRASNVAVDKDQIHLQSVF